MERHHRPALTSDHSATAGAEVSDAEATALLDGLAAGPEDPDQVTNSAHAAHAAGFAEPIPVANVEITLGADGTRILIDGHDISSAVRPDGVRVRSGGPDQPPVVTLELLTERVEIDGTPVARLYMSEPVVDALMAAGWSPPSGSQ